MSTQVSVLMSVLNGERYLHGAIDSILGQTFTCFEFIVIDDGSNDGTAEILSSYRDPRIRVIRSEQRAGVAATLNKGLGLASGEYIARQDADDISLPDRLQKQWAFLKDHPEVGVLGTWVHLIDEDGRVISDWHPPEHHAMIAWAQLFSSALAHPSIIFRRRVVVDAGGYPQEAAEDFALWAQLAPLTRFANLPETLVLYRRHEDAVTMAHQNLIHNNTLQVLRCTSSTLLNRQTDLIEATYLDAISSGRALASAAERSEERRVGKECRSRWSPYH